MVISSISQADVMYGYGKAGGAIGENSTSGLVNIVFNRSVRDTVLISIRQAFLRSFSGHDYVLIEHRPVQSGQFDVWALFLSLRQ